MHHVYPFAQNYFLKFSAIATDRPQTLQCYQQHHAMLPQKGIGIFKISL